MASAVVVPPQAGTTTPPTLEEKFKKIETAAAASGAAGTETAPSPDATTTVETTETAPLETPATEVDEEIDLEQAPESSGDFAQYKPLFADHPELKTLLGREKAFTEMQGDQPFSEFREIHEMVPTLEDAQRMVEESDNAREYGRTFREEPALFVASLKESDPQAFRGLIENLPEYLAKSDESLWVSQATFYLNRVLANAFAIASNEKNEAYQNALKIVAQELGLQPGRQSASAVNPEVEELRRKLDEKNKSESDSAFVAFKDGADDAVREETLAVIVDKLKTALPTATESQMKRMVNESYSALLEAMGAQPQFVAQLNRYFDNARKGRQSISDHNAIVRFAVDRSKIVIPRVVKGVIQEWGSLIVKTNKSEIDKKKAVAATTKDVGAGPQATTSAASTTPVSAPKTREDVFKQLEAGTYVPPARRTA